MKKLLDSYEIDGDKLINNNANILNYAGSSDVKDILDYLITELEVKRSAIEKCPSVLTIKDVKTLKENY